MLISFVYEGPKPDQGITNKLWCAGLSALYHPEHKRLNNDKLKCKYKQALAFRMYGFSSNMKQKYSEQAKLKSILVQNQLS